MGGLTLLNSFSVERVRVSCVPTCFIELVEGVHKDDNAPGQINTAKPIIHIKYTLSLYMINDQVWPHIVVHESN